MHFLGNDRTRNDLAVQYANNKVLLFRLTRWTTADKLSFSVRWSCPARNGETCRDVLSPFYKDATKVPCCLSVRFSYDF